MNSLPLYKYYHDFHLDLQASIMQIVLTIDLLHISGYCSYRLGVEMD